MVLSRLLWRALTDNDRSVFLRDGKECLRFACKPDGRLQTLDVPYLQCNYEEENTRLNLRACHASKIGHNVVFISSPDTDVAVFATGHCYDIFATLLFLTGTKYCRRCINLTQVGKTLGKKELALPVYHAFTRCDTTRAFVSKGKALPLEFVWNNESFCHAMQLIGQIFDADLETLSKECQSYVCKMYGHDGDDVNAVRYSMFCAKVAESTQFPSTKDALELHIKELNIKLSYGEEPWKLSQIFLSFVDTVGWSTMTIK